MSTGREDRVRANTAPAVNARIDNAMRDRLFSYSTRSDAEISARIDALDQEWDIERYLEVIAPAVSLGGLVLGLTRDRRWLALPTVVLAFLVQHAVQGWCPPLGFLRRGGVRTRRAVSYTHLTLPTILRV